jgi:thiamine pyrophosphokinase
MHVTIFANGDLLVPEINLSVDTTIIAADGGAGQALKLGLIPQIVIGDFDSLEAPELATLEKNGCQLINHPANKDETDLELALDHALALGTTEIVLYGLLGGRWDMSFANILLLTASRYAGIRFRIMTENAEIFILRRGGILAIEGQPGDTVSVIPLNGSVAGLTYEGLAWPLENAKLAFGSPRGVSNQMVGANAKIKLSSGVALVVVKG